MFPWIYLALLIPFHYALYKLFIKAGQPGWAALVPIYNAWIVQKKICKKPWWWIFFLLMPGINLVMFGCICYNLARAFGKYTSKELFSAVVFFPYFFVKIAHDKNTVFVPKDKRPVRKKSVAREWGEAFVFAVIAATFIKGYVVEPYQIPTSSMEDDLMVGDFLLVTKVNYGLKLPQTPLTFPFTHNNFYDLPGPIWPFAKSYSNAWKLPLIKLPALESIDHNEIVVFNFPANDTTIQNLQLHAHNYYVIVAQEASAMYYKDQKKHSWDFYTAIARKSVLAEMPIVCHPVDKRNNYIKRCVGLPGDLLEVRLGDLYINDQLQVKPKKSSKTYKIIFKDNVNQNSLLKLWNMNVSPEDMTWQDVDSLGRLRASEIVSPQTTTMLAQTPHYFKLTDEQLNKVKSYSYVQSVTLDIDSPKVWSYAVYPNHPKVPWNKDNFGPLTIPKKGWTVELNEINFILYKRVIEAYEGHQAVWKGGQALIDGKVATSYTFQQHYYFMMGDNRHGSADSRFWGFVPHDHIVGKALIVVASTNTTGVKKFPNNIRWNRFFKIVN